ncbi:MAG: hypothetical protein OXF01_08335, partial [Gemmatimonadetes bacterium]|nr:hypothetical protein [Gemmatimonadota bacterium]
MMGGWQRAGRGGPPRGLASAIASLAAACVALGAVTAAPAPPPAPPALLLGGDPPHPARQLAPGR